MKLPKMQKIKQSFIGSKVSDIDTELEQQLKKINISSQMKPGMRIAITAGSRGIANIAKIIRALVIHLKKLHAEPFIVPAMGSHGGATAEGQVEVLHSLGITEEYCQAPIHSSMQVVQIGETKRGMSVHLDQQAWQADGIILVGRIKVHTDFKSPIGIESGLMKMASIGLGKHKQALLAHSHGVEGIRDHMPEIAEVVLEKAAIICGIAIIENAYEETAILEAIPAKDIPSREKELLQKSAQLMPKLPVEDIDLLIVDEIGKNYSGTGMDTNIIGRIRIRGVEEPFSPRIKYIFARDVSEESHGNALGIGLADVTTKRLFDKIDFEVMNENVITSTFLQRGAVPLVLDDDKKAIEAALRACWGIDSSKAKIVHISNTLHLEEMYISESLLIDIDKQPNLHLLDQLVDMKFDSQGLLYY